MEQQARGRTGVALGLSSVGLSLCVWTYIIARAPAGAFRNQGGLAITICLFPLTLLGWAIGGVGAILWGTRALTMQEASGERWVAVSAILLGVLGLPLALGTCIVPEGIARALFGA